MTTAADLVDVLRGPLRTSTLPPDDPNGLWRGDAGRSVRTLGVALTAPLSLAESIAAHSLDALWLHRPWSEAVASLPVDFPVLAHHLSFDEALTPGYSPVIAEHFGVSNPEPFGEKDGRPIGMIGNVEVAPLAAWIDRLRSDFGGYEAVAGYATGPALVRRVAFAGAFWPELVEQADQAGVDLYVTGQLRAPGLERLRGRDLTALALGHARCEARGLDRLQKLLAGRFPEMHIVRLEAP